ncbi:MAG: hypothetical protein IJK64_07810 [Clostridia bacterium]|nr:hypothetical protein [Clostridia bacterium]
MLQAMNAVYEYLNGLWTGLRVLSVFIFPMMILYSGHSWCRNRRRNGRSTVGTILIGVMFGVLFLAIAGLLLYDFFRTPTGPTQDKLFTILLLPLSLFSALFSSGFLMIPIVFLWLYLLNWLEKREPRPLLKPFAIAEGVAVCLGILFMVLSITQDMKYFA